MKKIYVCSPYGGLKENYEKAKMYAKYVVRRGHIPIIPHTMLHEVLEDRIPTEREKGLEAGKMLMTLCDEMWVFGSEITAGMSGEIIEASRLGLKTEEIKNLPIEGSIADEISRCLKVFDKYFGGYLNGQIVYDLRNCIDKGVSSELIIECMKKAARKQATWNYAYGILKSCIRQGIFTAQEFLNEKKLQCEGNLTHSAEELNKIEELLKRQASEE